MGQLIHQAAFYIHVIAGSIALIVFWIPMLAKKGAGAHRQYGAYFANAMYGVSLSGLLMSSLVLLDPVGIRAPARDLSIEVATHLAEENRLFAGFLFMLSILVLTSVRHALLVLDAKTDRSRLRSASHLGLNGLLSIAGLTVGGIGLSFDNLLFQIFAIICLVTASGNFHYIFKPRLKAREWLIAHLTSILGAGIGAYTAFFVFGGSRLFRQVFSGDGQVILWVIPGVIGTIASFYLARKYRGKYRVA